jgi:hypothetical protein
VKLCARGAERDDGTPVLSVPVEVDFEFAYGPGRSDDRGGRVSAVSRSALRSESPSTSIPDDLSMLKTSQLPDSGRWRDERAPGALSATGVDSPTVCWSGLLGNPTRRRLAEPVRRCLRRLIRSLLRDGLLAPAEPFAAALRRLAEPSSRQPSCDAGRSLRRCLLATLGRSLRAALRRLAGAFFAAAFLRRLAGAFRAAVFRVVFLATRRLAGLRAVAFFVVFRAVRLFAGGTVTTFLEGCSGVGAVPWPTCSRRS